MSEQEVKSFLAANDIGVLALGVDDRAYGFPISYTYDEAAHRVLLGFVSPPESEKQRFATGTDEATFTVFSHDDVDAWKSVLVRGSIQQLDEADGEYRVPDIVFQQARDGDEKDDVVNLDTYDRTWYALAIERLTGRHSGD